MVDYILFLFTAMKILFLLGFVFNAKRATPEVPLIVPTGLAIVIGYFILSPWDLWNITRPFGYDPVAEEEATKKKELDERQALEEDVRAREQKQELEEWMEEKRKLEEQRWAEYLKHDYGWELFRADSKGGKSYLATKPFIPHHEFREKQITMKLVPAEPGSYRGKAYNSVEVLIYYDCSAGYEVYEKFYYSGKDLQRDGSIIDYEEERFAGSPIWQPHTFTRPKTLKEAQAMEKAAGCSYPSTAPGGGRRSMTDYKVYYQTRRPTPWFVFLDEEGDPVEKLRSITDGIDVERK